MARMAAKREPPGLADIIATIISPVLIMAMVGSLIFFLIAVIYGGQYSAQLRWTFFFFVFVSVLIAPISIHMAPAKASLYALPPAAASFLLPLPFLHFP